MFLKSQNYTDEWYIEYKEDYISKAFQILGVDIEKANKPKKKEGEPITITNRKTGKQMSGHWRTINGNRVFVSSDGKIEIAPDHIKEKFEGKESKNNEVIDAAKDKNLPKNEARFNEVTEKLNKMFRGSEEQKDKLVSDLKTWLKLNRNSDDKAKVEAIKSFLADKNIF